MRHSSQKEHKLACGWPAHVILKFTTQRATNTRLNLHKLLKVNKPNSYIFKNSFVHKTRISLATDIANILLYTVIQVESPTAGKVPKHAPRWQKTLFSIVCPCRILFAVLGLPSTNYTRPSPDDILNSSSDGFLEPPVETYLCSLRCNKEESRIKLNVAGGQAAGRHGADLSQMCKLSFSKDLPLHIHNNWLIIFRAIHCGTAHAFSLQAQS